MKRVMMMVAMMVVAACPAIVTAETDKMAVKFAQANSNQDKIAVLQELFEKGKPMTHGSFYNKLEGNGSPRMSGVFVGVNTDSDGVQQEFLGGIDFRAYPDVTEMGPVLGGQILNSIKYSVGLPAEVFSVYNVAGEVVNPDLGSSIIEFGYSDTRPYNIVIISLRKNGPYTVGKITITGIGAYDRTGGAFALKAVTTEGYFYSWK